MYLLFICLAAVPWEAAALNYSLILNLNASCAPKDTCAVPRDLDDPDHHNCDCSALCALYDTCCVDSPFLGSIRRRSSACRSSGPSGEHAFMVDFCPKSYSGPFRRRCEREAKDWSDPFDRVPVTNLNTQTTYKSLFCALCHGEDPGRLRVWQIALDCTGLKENMKVCQDDKRFVLQNMIYLREKQQWGLWSHDNESDWMFRRIGLDPKLPEDMTPFVKRCRPGLVSQCRPDWSGDADIRKLCRAYTAAVYFPRTAYRNVHCAICNFEQDLTAMSCHGAETSDFKGAAMNFGMLLDINLSDGDNVGTVEAKCGQGQVFDPFAKRCRDIECPIPGYSLKDGKCSQN
ncbi:hypothetical protein JTE90_016130 [Oedothorax gibbosus]|uniref:SMB domain-containing protein n=1 Tax=Oedothorax gibbosus TaxID=931172 RepID=A0AAV6U6F9_9ARAC|nr:hypothetical protein JTE90_016130 [Oedothorax gibbosus]